ncbi:hypothetical protein K4B79_06535 [Streptomyces lincolnensis]|uniref:hypothetical protein n=1 Tax=Streptomyces lincolnensis TaxID=1915 RepID=UPI001E507546|nr:hypothetical protein [Streptomyces lincolnensis]MCD7437882.1 hypothetical protein [Streptomyces lincolnensis]
MRLRRTSAGTGAAGSEGLDRLAHAGARGGSRDTSAAPHGRMFKGASAGVGAGTRVAGGRRPGRPVRRAAGRRERSVLRRDAEAVRI